MVDVGIAFDLRSDFAVQAGAPDDRLEEYDSEATVEAIAGALAAAGHHPRRLGGGRKFLEAVLSSPPELVFNIAEGFGTRSREAHVPAVCEMLKIPVTHSDPLTLALALDKAMAKRVVASGGIATPDFAVVSSAAELEALKLPLPLIAKPLFEGSSMGIRQRCRVQRPEELRAVVLELLQAYGQPVLLEVFQTGPELTVGVMGTGASARVIGAMEIVPKNQPLDEFVYSVEVKRNYLAEVEYHTPPRRPAALMEAVEAVALGAHRVLGCRDVSRVDVRLGGDGIPRFIEVNPLPGLNPVSSDLCILARGQGLEFSALVAGIVDSAQARMKR
ncbi:MAG: D-alanine--D-alanine ligase [Myxococcota bacterium]